MKLFAVRHAETTYNRQGLVLGRTPGELTPEGRAATQLIIPEVKALGAHVLAWASDLQRVVQTVSIIQQGYPELNVTFTPLLEERNFGDYEGRPHAELAATGFWELPPSESRFNAESEAVFTARIARFIAGLPTEPADATILLFTHIGVLNRLHYLEDPANFDFVNYPNSHLIEFNLEDIRAHSRELLQSTADSVRVVLFDQSNLDRFLVLTEADDPGNWKLPGGKFEQFQQQSESPVAAAARELHEELGVGAQQVDLRPVATLINDDGKSARYIFAGAINPHHINPTAEIAGTQWFTAGSLPDCKNKRHILSALAAARPVSRPSGRT